MFKILAVVTTPEGEDIFSEKTVDFNEIPDEIVDIINTLPDNVEYSFYMEDKKGNKTFLINSDIAKLIKKNKMKKYIDLLLDEWVFPQII